MQTKVAEQIPLIPKNPEIREKSRKILGGMGLSLWVIYRLLSCNLKKAGVVIYETYISPPASSASSASSHNMSSTSAHRFTGFFLRCSLGFFRDHCHSSDIYSVILVSFSCHFCVILVPFCYHFGVI